MKFIKEHLFLIIVSYLFVSFFITLMRMATTYGKPMDCELRYVDFVFPLTRLHCPVSFK